MVKLTHNLILKLSDVGKATHHDFTLFSGQRVRAIFEKNETSSSGFILRRRRVSRSSSLSFEEKWQRVKRQDGEFREKLIRNPVFSVKSCTMHANCLNETINLSLLDFI